jgi:hypothetical protein
MFFGLDCFACFYMLAAAAMQAVCCRECVGTTAALHPVVSAGASSLTAAAVRYPSTHSMTCHHCVP